jgi:TolB protein
MTARGTALHQLVPDAPASNPAWSTDPDWSSRGLVAFQRGYSDTGSDIYVVRQDGSGLRRMTFRGGESPAWSPDGRRLAFSRGFDEIQHIYVLDLRSRRLKRLTDLRGIEPTWSPDGRWIAFSADETRRRGGIYVVRARGGRARRIATQPFLHSYSSPDWQALR